MFNSNKPSLEELPTSAQLLKSTVIAAVSAAVILITIVLPSEYGIDPTRIGRVLGLAEMGEIKAQLAEEAEADKAMQSASDDQRSGGFHVCDAKAAEEARSLREAGCNEIQSTDEMMKTFLQNLSGPKIVFAAVLLALALVALMMIFGGGDPTGGHGHSHD